MSIKNTKTEKRIRLKKKIRTKVSGTSDCPRLSVFRSNAHIYAQLIDDTKGGTLAAASDMGMEKGTKKEHAAHVGKTVAEAAKKLGIAKVIFDRNGFRYTGRVALLAAAARDNGLTF